MGILLGRVKEGTVLISVFGNKAIVSGKEELISNIKIENSYVLNGNWVKTNCYSEREIEQLLIAIGRYRNKQFDAPKGSDNKNDK